MSKDYMSKESINATIRDTDSRWVGEIEKYFPNVGLLSCHSPEKVIPWLFRHVDIKGKCKND